MPDHGVLIRQLQERQVELQADIDALVAAGSYSDEQARDAIGTALTDSSTIDFTPNDGADTITADVKVTSLTNSHISGAAAIDPTKISPGTVNSTELGYLDGVTSSVQTQLTARVLKAGDTMTGALNGVNGSAAATSFSVRAAGNGMYSSAGSTLDLASGGTQGVSMTTSAFNVQSSRAIQPLGGINLGAKVAGTFYVPPYFDSAADGQPTLSAGITSGATTMSIDDTSLFEGTLGTPCAMQLYDGVNTEWVVVTSISAGAPGSANIYRNLDGAGSFAFAAGTTLYEFNPTTIYDNFVMRTDSPFISSLGQTLAGNITVWTPRRSSSGTWVRPSTVVGSAYRIWKLVVADCAGYTITLKEPDALGTVAQIGGYTAGGGGRSPASIEFLFDQQNGIYIPVDAYKEV